MLELFILSVAHVSVCDASKHLGSVCTPSLHTLAEVMNSNWPKWMWGGAGQVWLIRWWMKNMKLIKSSI